MKTIILFVQNEIKAVKQQYKDGKITLKEMQLTCKHLNNVALFAYNTKEVAQ